MNFARQSAKCCLSNTVIFGSVLSSDAIAPFVEIISLTTSPLNIVSRSLAACEGALLVVDASQGVEAQTMANVYLALENNLEIITCVNKIDLPNADAEKVMQEVESTIGLDTSNSIKCSAKTGIHNQL